MSNPFDMAKPGTPITPAERKAIEAYRRHGTYKEAAAALRLSPRTVQHQLATARTRTGVTRSHQLPDV
jgi:DNA-binding CsgD family transcriptional regulator